MGTYAKFAVTTCLGAMLAFSGCDRPSRNPVQRARESVDEAREVAAIDAEQKIQAARQMISLGRLPEARSIIEPLAADLSRFPQATQDKIVAAQRELEQAR